ncbi:hypothetical protein J2Y00_000348 [Deinococcus soli (ex Cha et al. 2016)]|uniref:Uncharacterized protein n=2 Tax=Deinococcus soli (ex Cha et al. 2016) TaxID=1309411 RepID=A0ACC6KBQ0_9DEIO|nr:hypothetical protein [Deinococcus soli (ex Cha et al. 2016)]MDR6327620.1 hypothetical protein [Deinococcus soli (ex Cha et al. 2016)]MDR6749895.1 hypothetical protein [Deinococcus soli (ex Cha et al. 2016)]
MIRRDRDENAHAQPGRLLTAILSVLLLMLLGGTLARLL